jgi:hypothetical protein
MPIFLIFFYFNCVYWECDKVTEEAVVKLWGLHSILTLY